LVDPKQRKILIILFNLNHVIQKNYVFLLNQHLDYDYFFLFWLSMTTFFSLVSPSLSPSNMSWWGERLLLSGLYPSLPPPLPELVDECLLHLGLCHSPCLLFYPEPVDERLLLSGLHPSLPPPLPELMDEQ
jgi:hypothetical protein